MTFEISQYDPSLFQNDAEQPMLHLYAVSGNQYVAQYDPDAGYFFTDEIICVVDQTLIAQEIPGRIYEPLEAFEFYRYPGTAVTIRDILNSPAIRWNSDCASEAAEALNQAGFELYAWEVDQVEGLEKSVKVEVNYDHRRGAEVSVFYYHQVPFMVTSRAGRELSDCQFTWILDSDRAGQVAAEFTSMPEIAVTDIDATVNLAYWEGCPVKLGDRFWGTQRPESGRDD